MRKGWVVGRVVIWQRVAALSRTIPPHPEISLPPPPPPPSASPSNAFFLPLRGEYTERKVIGEMLSAHSAAQSSWLCHIPFLSTSPPPLPPLPRYLHMDPIGWNRESISEHSDAFEVQDRWEAPGTVKNESRLVIGEMFWILSPISYLSGALSGAGRLQSAPLM